MADPTAVLLILAGLGAMHPWGDYWLQTNRQAQWKGRCGSAGRWACAKHVTTLTLGQAAVAAALLAVTATAVDPASFVLGIVGINAATHYWADRRTTLRGLVVAIDPFTGKKGFYDEVPGGALHLDQAWHVAWMVPAAVAVASPVAVAVQIVAVTGVVLAVASVASKVALRRERDTEPSRLGYPC